MDIYTSDSVHETKMAATPTHCKTRFKSSSEQGIKRLGCGSYPQELDVDLFPILVYPLRSRGKDGHSAAAQIVSG